MRYKIVLEKFENFEDSLRSLKCENPNCNGLATETIVGLDDIEHCYCLKHCQEVLDNITKEMI